MERGALGDEQRRFVRRGVSLAVCVWLADAGGCEEPANRGILSQPRTAFIDDLSVSGLRFVSPAAFPLRSVVGVRLRLAGRTFQLEGLVCRREAEWVSGKRCWGCGVQFVRTPDTPQAILCIAKYVMSAQSALPSTALLEASAPPRPHPSTPALTPKTYPWES